MFAETGMLAARMEQGVAATCGEWPFGFGRGTGSWLRNVWYDFFFVFVNLLLRGRGCVLVKRNPELNENLSGMGQCI